MGLFDFFKGKGKRAEETRAEKPQDASILSDDAIEIVTKTEAEEGVTLKVGEQPANQAIAKAVHQAMDVHEIEFHLAAGGLLYQEADATEEGADAEGSAEVNFTRPEEEEETVPEVTPALFEERGAEKEAESIGEASNMLEEEVIAEALQEQTTLEEEAKAEAAETETVGETAKVPEELPPQKEPVKEEVVEPEAGTETAKMPEEPIKKEKKGFFAKLAEGLQKTRNQIVGSIDTVLGAFTKIDEDLFEELEEALIMADLGVTTTMQVMEALRKRVKQERAEDPKLVKGFLADEITRILLSDTPQEAERYPAALLVIGVNGVGKTTTIGKLAARYQSEGRSVLLAAADTFRAAAIDQLQIWGERTGIEVIRHQEGSDPAAVVFDAANAAKRRGTDLLICDTAGRLHNKKNLMEELKKISKVLEREHPQAQKQVYLVLDATTGQNALQQAKLFREVTEISGIVLTKLDGTAKGGIVVAIQAELKIPVRFIGVGEGVDDLQPFDAAAFAKALFEV